MIGTETYSTGSQGWGIALNGTNGGINFDLNNSTAASGIVGTAAINTWNHYALVRNGSNCSSYLNGTSIYSGSCDSVNIAGSNSLTIGRAPAGLNYFYSGYIDEVRISNIARWTTNFTPPTVPYSSAVGFPKETFSVTSSNTQTGFIGTNGNDSNNLEWGTTGAAQLALTTGGNFGIGTTSPANLLEVNGTAKIDTSIIASNVTVPTNSTTAWGLFYANGATNLIDADTTNGRVGIGTTAPATTLDVEGGNFTLGSSGTPEYIVNNGTQMSPYSAFPMFGTGADGNVTISSGTTTLTRDMMYNNLTISGTGILNERGYKML